MSDSDSAQRLAKQLANTARDLLLSRQIVRQLEMMRKTSSAMNGIVSRLYDSSMGDITDEEELQELKGLELKLQKQEKRLQMLQRLQAITCSPTLKRLAIKKSPNGPVMADTHEGRLRSRRDTRSSITSTIDSETELKVETETKLKVTIRGRQSAHKRRSAKRSLPVKTSKSSRALRRSSRNKSFSG